HDHARRARRTRRTSVRRADRRRTACIASARGLAVHVRNTHLEFRGLRGSGRSGEHGAGAPRARARGARRTGIRDMNSAPRAAASIVGLLPGVSALAPGLLWLRATRTIVAADVHFAYEDV